MRFQDFSFRPNPENDTGFQTTLHSTAFLDAVRLFFSLSLTASLTVEFRSISLALLSRIDLRIEEVMFPFLLAP